ncbi:MAG: F0F1 ATP synthase subunit delta [Gammaproteobacteria bacterium]|nr:F0F1 ATP synthase subunit delta [Gammaproteobacteria bacterium]
MAENTTIARPYVQAIFDLAQSTDSLDSWSDILQGLALIAADAEAVSFLGNPRVSNEQKLELFSGILGDDLPEAGLNLVRLLLLNQRIALLPDMAHLYEVERNRAAGSIDAQLITARPATEQQKTSICNALKVKLGREIHLECKTDETLIGGAIIQAGDLVIDGSAQGKLNRLASALIH